MSSVIIDTHCHPQFPHYDRDRDEMLRRAFDVGVGMICVGTDWEMSKAAIALAERHASPPSSEDFGRASIWAAVGIHPNDDEQQLEHLEQLEQYEELLQHPKVVAVGEVGLDYYRTVEPHKQERQREVFKMFIDLAARHYKPLIIHCRGSTGSPQAGSTGSPQDAHTDMISIIENCKLPARNDFVVAKSGGRIKNFPRGVIHSFTGTYADARRYIDMGFYIGLNGIITFARDYDDTVMNIPLERILLETDAPYLTPEPHRGKRNEPAYVVYVAEQIARLRRISAERVIIQTTQNARKLFGI